MDFFFIHLRPIPPNPVLGFSEFDCLYSPRYPILSLGCWVFVCHESLALYMTRYEQANPELFTLFNPKKSHMTNPQKATDCLIFLNSWYTFPLVHTKLPLQLLPNKVKNIG